MGHREHDQDPDHDRRGAALVLPSGSAVELGASAGYSGERWIGARAARDSVRIVLLRSDTLGWDSGQEAVAAAVGCLTCSHIGSDNSTASSATPVISATAPLPQRPGAASPQAEIPVGPP
jgi:hypothetical protein